MSGRRIFRPRKKDANHANIASAFIVFGCSVAHVSSDEKAGIPDLVCGLLGRDHFVEIKKPLVPGKVSPSQSALSPEQVKFAAEWRGAPVQMVRTPEDAAKLVQLWRLEASNADRAALLLKRELDEVLEAANK